MKKYRNKLYVNIREIYMKKSCLTAKGEKM